MISNKLFLTALIISTMFTSSADMIHLQTKDSQMSFVVEVGKKLIRQYYGRKLMEPQNAQIASTSRTLAYPTQWDRQSGDCCISVIQGDGKKSLDLVYVGHKVSHPKEGQELLEFQLKDAHYAIQVTIRILAHQNSNVYEQSVDVCNMGEAPIAITQSSSGHLELQAKDYYVSTFRGAWAGESLMSEEKIQAGNVLESSSFTGARTAQEGTPAFIISLDQPAQENIGEVYMGALAWSGNYTLRFKQDAHHKLLATFGADTVHDSYILEPKKTLNLPRWIVTHSVVGKGPASRQLHAWARESGIRGGDDERLTLLNSWEGAYFTFDESLLHKMMEDAAGMGVELFVLDDGWFGNKYPRNNDREGLGDWDVNCKKLPCGIDGLVKAAKNQNIKFGIWVEPEMVNPRSALYEKHPDWVIKLPNRPEREQRNQLILDMSRPEVQEYIIQFMTDLLRENPDIAYVKWDCNRNISDPGSSYQESGKQGNLYIDYVQGYYAVLDSLMKDFPHVVFQACGSGGGRADYGAMKYHHEFWASDNTDPLERIYMQWSIGHVFPAKAIASHVTASPNHQTGRVTPLKFRFDVAMTGRLGFELRPEKLMPSEIEFSKKAVNEYKRIRPVIQGGDLYRLRSPFDNADSALMYLKNEGDKQHAVVFAFLSEKRYTDKFSPLKLEGLDPLKRYVVKEINLDNKRTLTPIHEKTIGGDYLMYHGIPIAWGKALDSVVLEIIAL